MGKSSTFQISLKLLTQQFTKGLNNVQKQLKSFGNFVKGAFGLTALVTFGRKVIETGAQFEDAMARVQAVSNATAGEMAMMTKEAERLGATTKYSASEAANALENLTRNGMSAGDATKTLEGVLKLAQANAIGLAEAADILTNTMNIFGLEAKDTSRINDVLSATCANSATNINQLAEAVYGVGPIAKIMGKSIEETTAALGVMANNGVKGSAAGTALGAMMQTLSAQTPKAKEALAKFGLNIDETTLKTHSLSEVLQMLKDSGLAGSVEALRAVFGRGPAGDIATLINNVEQFNALLEKTQNAAGTTERMFKQGVGSTENAIKSLKSAYEGFLNSIFKQTSGVFNSIVKGLTNIVRALSDAKTRTTAIIGTVVSLLTVNLVKAMQKVRTEAGTTAARLSVLKTGITTITAAAKAAYAAMGGWVGILVTLGSVIVTSFVNSVRKANEIVRDVKDTENSFRKEVELTKTAVWGLYKIVKDDNVNLETRAKALEELKKKVKDYHGELDKEKGLINDNKEALENYIKAIGVEMEIQAKQATLLSLYNRKQAAELALLSKAQEDPTNWEKVQAYVLAFLKTNLARAGTAQAGQGLHGEYEVKLDDVRFREIKRELEIVEKLISEYSKKMTPEELAKVFANLTGGTSGGGGGGGNDSGSSKDKKSNPDEDLAYAAEEFDYALREAASKLASGSLKIEDVQADVISAYEKYIEAFVKYSAAVGHNKIFDGEAFQEINQAYKNLIEQTNDLAALRKAQKDKEETRKHALEELERGRARLNAKDSKSQIKNPWDNFSSNPKDYRDEERAVQELQNKLENLISTYESLKDKVKDIGTPTNDKEREVLNWWTDLKNLIAQTTEEYQRQANALGSKKAMDEINQKTIDQRRAYYDMIRNTSSAVGQLASNLQSLSDADWSTMTVAEKFNTISNAIFGTIDAVLNVIDTFKSLQEIIDSLTMAKTAYAAIEEATSKQEQKNAEAEGAAALAKGADELAAAQMSMIAGEVDKEVKRGVVAANSASAISGAAAAMASIPYVGPFLATAAATEMEALLAAMLPKFASGGIIQGNSKYGDRLLARVNAGEMILNAQQQKRLFDIANGHGGLGAGQVSFHIAGKDLVGVLRNNNAANAKISGAKGL